MSDQRPFANHVVKAQDPAKQAAAIERDKQDFEFVNNMINSVYGDHTPDCDFPCMNDDHHETTHLILKACEHGWLEPHFVHNPYVDAQDGGGRWCQGR